jgi:hypothetical protein
MRYEPMKRYLRSIRVAWHEAQRGPGTTVTPYSSRQRSACVGVGLLMIRQCQIIEFEYPAVLFVVMITLACATLLFTTPSENEIT